MTPESHTIYSMLLFSALVALQQWSNRRHRFSRHFREGVAVALMSHGESTVQYSQAWYRSLRTFNSRSARNQFSQSEPPWYPRASQ